MRALVTGAAGFIGSHLAEALVADGHDVVGVDCFTSYYPRGDKAANVKRLNEFDNFTLVETDLRTDPLDALVEGIEVVFHQAGQPGVRLSWSHGFPEYLSHNVSVTQRLLETVRDSDVRRFVFASSSSVYGNAERYPTLETDAPSPFSPYGVTKLAAEHLCGVYARNWSVPAVSLRYFTVFGPRQRPDMAFHRFVEATLSGEAIPLYGSGAQVRDFTFVSDVVAANVAAATKNVEPGSVFNIAGGASTTVNEVVTVLERLLDRPVAIERLPQQPGDVERTGGSIDLARSHLGWEPAVRLEDGLRAQVDWHLSRTATNGA